METLRETSRSLLTANPENDRASRSSTADTATQTHLLRSQADEDASHTPGVTLSMPPADLAPERFARGYSHPLFPCKAVPYAAAKRAFDLVFACLLLLLAAPFMLLAALLIKLTDRGPVFFKQVRVGEGGRYFWCYKFRSMCVDAEARKHLLLHLNEASGPVFKMKRDPRITPIGAILRKLSIDELPQLFNVLRGEMSVVGPRPPLPSEVAQYGERARQRLGVAPGLTCLWQINGRSNVSFERWVELDLLYIETMSFGSDVRIVLKTIPAVLFGSGAH